MGGGWRLRPDASESSRRRGRCSPLVDTPGTTMSEIAGRADVSIKTVEAVFGTKAAILRVAVDVAIAGDDEPVALLDRPTMQQGEETDLGRLLGLYAGLVTDISGRLAPLVSVVEQAAQTHPEIARALEHDGPQPPHRRSSRCGFVEGEGPLWPDVEGDRAADILFLFNDPLGLPVARHRPGLDARAIPQLARRHLSRPTRERSSAEATSRPVDASPRT